MIQIYCINLEKCYRGIACCKFTEKGALVDSQNVQNDSQNVQSDSQIVQNELFFASIPPISPFHALPPHCITSSVSTQNAWKL